MSLQWTNLTFEVDYEPGEGFAVRAKAFHRGNAAELDRSPWYDQLTGDELLDVMAAMCEQAWERKPLDGARELEEPQLPFDGA
jgi:acyl-CoA synthetase (NDP forming)